MDTVTITIRNVPDEVHADLVRRAKQRGMSLQAYMRELLDDIALRAEMRRRFREATAVSEVAIEEGDLDYHSGVSAEGPA